MRKGKKKLRISFLVKKKYAGIIKNKNLLLCPAKEVYTLYIIATIER